jgi:hypothetical protein
MAVLSHPHQPYRGPRGDHQGDRREVFGQPRRRHRLAERQDGQGTGAEIVREPKEVIT